MLKQIALLATLALAPLTAQADTLSGNLPVCDSAEHYLQVETALVKKDLNAWAWLINNKKCMVLWEGLPVSVLYRSWDGVNKLRVYIDDTAVIVYTGDMGVTRTD